MLSLSSIFLVLVIFKLRTDKGSVDKIGSPISDKIFVILDILTREINRTKRQDIVEIQVEFLKIIILNTHNLLRDHIEWETITQQIKEIGNINKQPDNSMSTRAKFINMDILDVI